MDLNTTKSSTMHSVYSCVLIRLNVSLDFKNCDSHLFVRILSLCVVFTIKCKSARWPRLSFGRNIRCRNKWEIRVLFSEYSRVGHTIRIPELSIYKWPFRVDSIDYLVQGKILEGQHSSTFEQEISRSTDLFPGFNLHADCKTSQKGHRGHVLSWFYIKWERLKRFCGQVGKVSR